MDLNKEDFRQFMLDSHESVQSKKSLQKRTVRVQKKDLSAVRGPCYPGSPPGSGIGRRKAAKHARLPAKEKAASEIPFVDTAPGQRQRRSLRVPPAEREQGQRLPWGAMVPPYPPTPQPARWESSLTWAGNGCSPRGVGQAFIWCESTQCL